jgi:murein DD-endopeptidase MepM/ murein hydrolase activator NlpD
VASYFCNTVRQVQYSGGWGDWYKMYCKFDLEGMPQNVTNASLWFMPYNKADGSTPVGITWYSANSYWDRSMTWGTQPALTWLGSTNVTPAPGQRWGGNINWIYNGWTSSLAQAFNPRTYTDWTHVNSTNNGILLAAQGNSNNFDLFRSESYVSDGDRPGWYIEFPRPANEPDFRMPLPSGGTCDPRNSSCIPGAEIRLYQVTSEIGGYDCAQTGGDTGHQDIYSVNDSSKPQFNYFAIDFVGPFLSTFTSTPGGKVPIIASADGVIQVVGTSSNDPENQYQYNGNYVIIRHVINGVDTKYSTLYLHMADSPAIQWSVGQTIHQGDLIGYMGSTGISSGTHLHFAIRYNDASPPVAGTTVAGAKNIPQLTNATMDGFLLKSYQTDCGSGGPNLRYYQSGNRQYQ